MKHWQKGWHLQMHLVVPRPGKSWQTPPFGQCTAEMHSSGPNWHREPVKFCGQRQRNAPLCRSSQVPPLRQGFESQRGICCSQKLPVYPGRHSQTSYRIVNNSFKTMFFSHCLVVGNNTLATVLALDGLTVQLLAMLLCETASLCRERIIGTLKAALLANIRLENFGFKLKIFQMKSLDKS